MTSSVIVLLVIKASPIARVHVACGKHFLPTFNFVRLSCAEQKRADRRTAQLCCGNIDPAALWVKKLSGQKVAIFRHRS